MGRFTKEQENWLLINYQAEPSYSHLTYKFNSKFSANRTVEQVREKCTKRLGLKGMPNPTQYGRKKKEELPIGTIRKSQTGTYIKVCLVDNSGITGYPEPYWLPLQKKIYQDTYGDILQNQMVCFLNHNPEDFRIENLYAIDRKISAIMSSNGWWSEDAELTLAAIKWCELYYAIKNVSN